MSAQGTRRGPGDAPGYILRVEPSEASALGVAVSVRVSTEEARLTFKRGLLSFVRDEYFLAEEKTGGGADGGEMEFAFFRLVMRETVAADGRAAAYGRLRDHLVKERGFEEKLLRSLGGEQGQPRCWVM